MPPSAEWLPPNIQVVQHRRERRLKHQGQLRLESHKGGLRLGTVADLNPESDLRELRSLGLDLLRHRPVGERVAEGGRHMTAPHAREVGDLRADLIKIGQLVAHVTPSSSPAALNRVSCNNHLGCVVN